MNEETEFTMQMQSIRYPSSVTGTMRACSILLPCDYTERNSYPVLYLLHGIGGTHTEWQKADPAQILAEEIRAGEAEKMIVVMPNVRAKADDGVPSDPKEVFGPESIAAFDRFIDDLTSSLMPYIHSHYAVSADRASTAIAGLSMGGREALYIGFTMLDTFGYIGSFSPAPGVVPYEPLHFPGMLTQEQLSVPEGKPAPYVLLLCNGTHDEVVFNVPTTYHEILERNGVDHIFYTMDAGHDFVIWKDALRRFVKMIFH